MRKFLLLCCLAIAFGLVPSARADSFELFAASGTFLNGPFLALGGGFVVDTTTGQVASVDLFYGTTELNLLGSVGGGPSLPDAFYIHAFDSLGDELALLLVAPGNAGSLAGYTGGPICGSFADNTACESLPIGGGSFFGTVFLSHLGVGYNFTDDLGTGSITDSGPAASVPEPDTPALLGIGLACLCVVRRRL